MPWKQDQPGCSCCGCERLVDDFSTDTIGNYTTSGNTWEIDDGTLQGYSSFGTTPIVIKSDVTSGLPAQIVGVNFKSPERKQVALCVGMTSLIRYMACIVEYDSEGSDRDDNSDTVCATVYFKYFSGMAGTTDVGHKMRVRNVPPDEFRYLEVCTQPFNNPATGQVASVGLYARINDQCLSAEFNQGLGTGVGLATWADDSSSVSYFDDLQWSDSSDKSTGGTNECPECGCDCNSFYDDFQGPDYTAEDVGRQIEVGKTVGCVWEVCGKNWALQRGAVGRTPPVPMAVGLMPERTEFPTGEGNCLAGWARSGSSGFGAHIKCLVPIVANDGAMSASVDVQGSAGCVAALHLDYGGTTAGECDFSYSAIFEWNIDPKKSRLGISDDGGESYLVTEQVDSGHGGPITLHACWDTKFKAWVEVGDRLERIKYSAGAPGGSPLAGLGVLYHDGTGHIGMLSQAVVRFDNFRGGQTGADCSGCDMGDADKCLCRRADGLGTVPKFLVVTQPEGLLYPGDNEHCPVGMCADLAGNFLLKLTGRDPGDVPPLGVGQPAVGQCCSWEARTAYGCVGHTQQSLLTICPEPLYSTDQDVKITYSMTSSVAGGWLDPEEHYVWSTTVSREDFYCDAFTATLDFELSDGLTECRNISSSTIVVRNG